MSAQARVEVATLAGGCYWCLEAIYEQLQGVESVVSGFSGGRVKNPSYREVCEGTTGHAEVVQVAFDPAILSYREVLDFFFAFHDPTTLNRQGADEGTQYRSAIFFHSPEQKAIALAVIDEMTRDKVFDAPIVTEVTPFEAFYPADAYHQGYYRANSNQPYCRAVITPKVTKLRQKYAAKLKTADKPS
jgi:peptide-methionine (S)-S-oxide reductase